MPTMQPHGAGYLAALLAALLVALTVRPAAAQWALPAPPSSLVSASQSGPVRCEQLPDLLAGTAFPSQGTQLALTSTDLDGRSVQQLCLFRDSGRDQYWALLPNVSSGTQFRKRKAALLPALAEAGIDPCRIAFWAPLTRNVQRETNMLDWHDAGRICRPLLRPHGPLSEARAAAVDAALSAAIAKGEEVFGWSPRWPIEIHFWDTAEAAAAGGAAFHIADFGSGREAGVTQMATLAMPVILIDTVQADRDDELRGVIAHEYGHMVQWGVTGCVCALPTSFIEGGAEYFAALVVGPDDPRLVYRLQAAKEEVRIGQATPLVSLLTAADAGSAAYIRGYAAFAFLTARWGGLAAYVGLYRAARGNTTDAVLGWLAARTGLSLDQFNEQLDDYLRSTRVAAPAAGPGALISPNALLLSLATVPLRGTEEGGWTDQIGPADTSVVIRYALDCFTTQTQVELIIYRPDGRRYGRGGGAVEPSCVARRGLRLDLDDAAGGSAMRSLPGLWRATVSVDGEEQGSLQFTLAPA